MLIAELAHHLIDARAATRRPDYRCPACHGPVRLHRGQQVGPYFAHLPASPCRLAGEGETAEHLRGKRQLATFFASWGLTTLERVLPAIQQRADVWVDRATQPVAVEFQCSPLSVHGVTQRTAGYHRLGCYPLWVLGHRYAHQKLNWSLLERFMTWLPRWELCLLFWDVTTNRLRVVHHLYQDAAGRYGGQTTVVGSVAALMVGPTHMVTYPSLDLAAVQRRWTRQLARSAPALRPIQEQVYLTGHHLLGFPLAFATTAITPPFLGRGLLLWRIVFGTWLFATTAPLTQQRVTALAHRSFCLVAAHDQAVRVQVPHLCDHLRTQFLAELTTAGYLRATATGWVICRQPQWRH